MKKSKVFNLALSMVLLGVLIVGSAWTYGGERGERGVRNYGDFKAKPGLNLTDDQKDQMKTLRLSFIKEMTPYKNDLRIKIAELKAASTGDNADQKAVFKLIDEISKIKTEMAKKKFTNKQKVRTLLTDEQKIMFDARAGNGHKGYHHRKGMRQGRSDVKGKFHKGMKDRKGQRFGDVELDNDSDIQG